MVEREASLAPRTEAWSGGDDTLVKRMLRTIGYIVQAVFLHVPPPKNTSPEGAGFCAV